MWAAFALVGYAAWLVCKPIIAAEQYADDQLRVLHGMKTGKPANPVKDDKTSKPGLDQSNDSAGLAPVGEISV